MDTWYSIDFETSSQNRYTCEIDRVCVGSFDLRTGMVQTPVDFNNGLYSILTKMMVSPHPKVMHNADFDLYLMEKRLGIKVNGEVHDTMLMTKHWRNDLPAYDLKSLSWYFFGDLYHPLIKVREWIHKHNMKGEDDIEFDMTQVPDQLVHDYCIHDIRMTARIASLLYPKVRDNYAYQQDTQIIRLNSDMEAQGITADVAFYRRFTRLGKRRIKRNTRQASDNLVVKDGKKPTGDALRKHLAQRDGQRKTATGLTKADDVVLRDHEGSVAVRAVQRVRKDTKLVNTYIRNILAVVNDEGKFYVNLRQSAAITRRWRASGFYGDNGLVVKGNPQNFPRGPGIRTGIITPPGYGFVKFDLSSIEARIGAHLMSIMLDEDWFAEQYRKHKKFNIYLHVASVCAGEEVKKGSNIYDAYKHGCLGVQYGVGVKTFYKTLHDKFELPYTFGDCDKIYSNIRKTFPVFSAIQRAVSKLVEDQGYIIDDFGAVYYVPEQERYKGVIYYCQGCAGNVLRWWWIEVNKLIKDTEDYLFNTVHDEFDGAIKRDRGALGRIKAYCDVLDGLDIFEVPIRAEASGLVDNWAEAG